MRILLVLAGLTLSLAAHPQEIYRWIDKDGQVHYADQPGAANAERVILADPNSYASNLRSATTRLPGPLTEDGDADGAAAYESLKIVQPTPDQVFFGADATVVVAAELGGTLRPDHMLGRVLREWHSPAGDFRAWPGIAEPGSLFNALLG